MMIRILSIALCLFAAPVMAADDARKPLNVTWPFEGPMGHFNDRSIQRGFQVYQQVCASCHGVKRLAFRNLTEVGFTQEEVKALAASYSIQADRPNEEGEMYDRPGRPSDHIPQPYDNKQQAKALNNGAYPPDLSLIIKARPHGADYVYSLLTGYEDPPKDMELAVGQYYNPYFPGGKIAMPQPLMKGQIDYQDGTSASVDQMSRDVVNFLQWAAEPKMETRKAMGLKVMAYLLILTFILYITKKRIWAKLDH